ncbi:MAG: glycosyltransferase family 39 protein [Chloroflexi bacterium]|nr:glycosyltransferase family 39 protein [Chloroflexota bacterium]
MLNYFSFGKIRIERGLLVMLVLFLASLPFVTPRVAASDEIEYFSYLPSILLDGDLNFRNQYEYFCNRDPDDCVKSRFKETFLDLKTPTGLQINFGPLGTAVLWLPFYLVAHLVALVLQNFNPAFAANGISTPYIYAVCVGSVFYGWLGIYLAYRIARHYFAEVTALGAALVILFATNAVYYMYVAPAFSHAASLFASALFVYVWWRTRDSRAQGNWQSWILLGASGGLMTMVREQEGVFFVIPLVEFLGVVYAAWRTRDNLAATHQGRHFERSKAEREISVLPREISATQFVATPPRNDIRKLLKNWILGGVVMVGGAFVVFVPQFLVYRVLNGNFLPARNVTDKFTWNGDHILDILFSNFHGLFTWTPVVLLAVAGLFFLWRRDKMLAAAFLVALAVETYLLGSFSTWFGGAAFGMRRFINCTVIFVVGLAAFAEALQTRVPRPVLAGVGALLILWNLFFILQFVTGMVPRQEPVDMLAMARNQIFAVPPRLFEIAQRFLTNRGSFYKQ